MGGGRCIGDGEVVGGHVLDRGLARALRELAVDEDASGEVDLALEGLAGELMLKSGSAHRGYVDVI